MANWFGYCDCSLSRLPSHAPNQLPLSRLILTLIIGDIIHLIGYYPNRPTTTSRPPIQDSNNKPYYQYPYNQNDWNYETNQIQHGPSSSSSYPSYNSPVSTSHNNHNSQKPHNSYNYNNYGGFMDDTGYAITPSPIVSGNDYNRPQATPSRPQSTNSYHQQDYPEDGFAYGSYQGIKQTI